MYGVLEKQFRIYFQNAFRKKGITGLNLLFLLESRLDNVIFRLGFANSRAEARQLVRHRHVLVNNRMVNIPSFQVRPNDKVEVREKSRKMSRILEALETADRKTVPTWLELDKEQFSGSIKSLPSREDISMDIDENLIVAFYTR